MTDTPGFPFIRWSADHKYSIIGPGVESDDFKLDNPVADLSAATLLALQTGTNRFVTRPIPAGLGDVVGPPGATDNALARFDGPSGTLIQDSAVTLDDAGGLAGVTAINGQPVAVLANEGGGAEVFHTGTPGTLRTLFGTANGLAVAQNPTSVTLDNTLTGANPSATPGAAGVFAAKAGATLNFRSLVAGVDITITPGAPTANDITIAAGGGAPPNDLAVYVSATGDDVTGDGSAGNPYLKIERALDDVRARGWNDTAAIRVLSTGGPYPWPADLNVTTGARGRQRLPLTIQGWNGNPTPGRSLVFSQAAVGASSDPTSFIVDLVGPGPYTAAQVGQRVRFTSGALANFQIAPGIFVAVDVAVAAVPNGTTLRLTWAASPPAPGDTFVVEALDTAITVAALSTVRSPDTLALSNLFFSGAVPFAGLMFLGGGALQLQAAHVVTGASAFVLTGDDDSLITGGDFNGLSLAGFTVDTASFFADGRGGGSFLTSIDAGPEGADWAVQFAGFVGSAILKFDGRLGQSVVDGPTLEALTFTAVEFVSLSAASLLAARLGGALQLSNVAAGRGLEITEGGRCAFQSLRIEGAPLTVDSGAVWGGGLAFGGAPLPTWVTVRGGGSLDYTSDLALPPATVIAATVDENATFRVFGGLTASGNGSAGLSVSGGSSVFVNGDSAFSSNGGSGLIIASGGRFVGGGSLIADLNGADGAQLANATVCVAGELGCSQNAAYGVDAAYSTISASILLPQTNGQANLRAVGCAIFSGGDFGADANSVGPAVWLDAGSRLSAAAFHSAGAAAEALLFTGGSAAAVQGDLTVTGAGSARAGVAVTGGSGLAVGGTLSSTANLAGAGVLVSEGATLACGVAGGAGGLLVAGANGGHGLSVSSAAVASVQTCQCLSNGGSGVSVATGGRFVAAVLAECSLNGGDGLALAGRATAYVEATTSAGGANTGFGVQALSGAKAQLGAGAQSGTGAGGDAKVGVNAAASWANIASGDPAFVADYLSGQNPTQLCEIAI